jgi:hypothetical protein
VAQRDVMSSKRGAAAQGKSAKADVTRFESAESALEREQASADAHAPDWDLASRISTAQAALARGVPADIVRKMYGAKVFAEATAKPRELAHAAS